MLFGRVAGKRKAKSFGVSRPRNAALRKAKEAKGDEAPASE